MYGSRGWETKETGRGVNSAHFNNPPLKAEKSFKNKGKILIINLAHPQARGVWSYLLRLLTAETLPHEAAPPLQEDFLGSKKGPICPVVLNATSASATHGLPKLSPSNKAPSCPSFCPYLGPGHGTPARRCSFSYVNTALK